MTSVFDALDAASQAAITDMFSDQVRIVPLSGDVNYGGGADAGRQPKTIRATFGQASKVTYLDYPGTQQNGNDALLAPAEIWIDRLAVASLGYEIRRGDKIEILDGTTPTPTFRVATVEPGDNGDLRVVLAK